MYASKESCLSALGRFGAGLAAGAVFVSLPNVSSAQQAGEDAEEGALDEIVITGSRIRRTGFETLQPAVVLDREKLELRSSIDLASALNEQAGFSVPLVSPD